VGSAGSAWSPGAERIMGKNQGFTQGFSNKKGELSYGIYRYPAW